jgi:uncharacterized protein YjgD (DUF1641 family)
MSFAGMTKDDMDSARRLIWKFLCEGKTDSEIAKLMGIDDEVYRAVKFSMLEWKSQELKNKPSEHIYVEYMIAQTQNIENLNDMIKSFKSSKQHNAMVSAIRARSELTDKILAKGQEFGIIARVTDHNIIGGLLIKEMSRNDLKSAITKAISKLSVFVEKYGDSDIMDLEPGDIHYGPVLQPHEEEEIDAGPRAPRTKSGIKAKKVKAKTAKTNKARGRKKIEVR